MGYSVFLPLKKEERDKVKSFFDAHQDLYKKLDDFPGIKGIAFVMKDVAYGYSDKKRAVFGVNYGGSGPDCSYLAGALVCLIANKLGHTHYIYDASEKFPVTDPWWEASKEQRKKWSKWKKVEYFFGRKITFAPLSKLLKELGDAWDQYFNKQTHDTRTGTSDASPGTSAQD